MTQPDRPHITIWRMRIACWIHSATDTHSKYVILIAFPRQQMLRDRASTLCYTGCIVGSFRGPFSAGKHTKCCKHSVASHWDTDSACLTHHGRTEALIRSQTERGKEAMISVTFLSPSKHGPFTVSITARPLIYRCIIKHQSPYPIIIQQSYSNHITIDVTQSHRRQQITRTT